MAGKDIRQKVTVDTGDSVKEIRDVEKAAKDTDKAVDEIDDREIDFETTEGFRRVRELQEEIKKLRDEEITIKADLDARGFQQGVRKIEDEQPGKRVGEQFVQDIGGAFGGTAFSQATADAVAAFETLGETLGATGAGAVVNKMGSVLIPALGIGGAIAGAIGGLWAMFSNKGKSAAEEMRKEIEDLARKINEIGVTAGLREQLETDWLETIPGTGGKRIIDFLDTLGLTFEDVDAIMNGKLNPNLERARDITEGWDAIPISDRDTETVEKYADSWGLTTEELFDTVAALSAFEKELDKQQGKLTKAIEDANKLRAIFPAEEEPAEPSRGERGGPTVGTQNNYYSRNNDGRDIDRAYQDYWRNNGNATWTGVPG